MNKSDKMASSLSYFNMSIGLKDSNMNRMKEPLINFLITTSNPQLSP